MVKQVKYVISVLALLLFSAFAISQLLWAKSKNFQGGESVEEWADYSYKRIPELMEAQDVPGLIIAVIQDRETVWIDAFGYADLENKTLMTKDTRCRVESISKSVTAWGVMKLEEDGLIGLNDSLEFHLNSLSLHDSPYPEKEVTVKRLLNQTSGMPLGTIGVRFSPTGNIPPLREYIKKDALLFQKPGDSFSYSNTGYNLLEILIEDVTGREFAEYMANEIMIPLGMKDSSFAWSENWRPPVPYGYDAKGQAVPVYIYPDKASGGLFATTADIASFVIAGMSSSDYTKEKVLDKESIEALYDSSTGIGGYYSLIFDGYGLGHFVEDLPGGLHAVSSGGQGSGWMTQFYSIPETGDGIVMISNSQRSWPLFSELLIEWSHWNGNPVVGMGLIMRCAQLLRLLILCGFIAVSWRLCRTVITMINGQRHFILQNRSIRKVQLLQIVISLSLTALIMAVSRMKYFFLDSVFPAEMPILKALILLTAGLLFLSALMPKRNTIDVKLEGTSELNKI